MREFIKLTLANGYGFWVRPSRVAYLYESDGNEAPRSMVGLVGTDHAWHMKESIDEILKLVSGSEEAKP